MSRINLRNFKNFFCVWVDIDRIIVYYLFVIEISEMEVIFLRNLSAEMARYGISNADIQTLLGCSNKTVTNKLTDNTAFSVGEAIKIRDTFFLGFASSICSHRQGIFSPARKTRFGLKGGEKIPIAGELTAMFLVSLGLLPKAVLEAAYFQDGESAKRTLQLWLWLISALCLSFLFLFLFYHYR